MFLALKEMRRDELLVYNAHLATSVVSAGSLPITFAVTGASLVCETIGPSRSAGSCWRPRRRGWRSGNVEPGKHRLPRKLTVAPLRSGRGCRGGDQRPEGIQDALPHSVVQPGSKHVDHHGHGRIRGVGMLTAGATGARCRPRHGVSSHTQAAGRGVDAVDRIHGNGAAIASRHIITSSRRRATA